jgi:hypothetical protein
MAVKMSALHAGYPLLPGRFLVLTSVTGWVDPIPVVQLEGLIQSKNSMTSSGTETMTFWLVAQCLNLECYRMPHSQNQTESELTTAHDMRPPTRARHAR